MYKDFRKIFSYICFKSFFHSQYDFTETEVLHLLEDAKNKLKIDFREENYFKDLVDIVCMLVKDGLKYKFIHRSFQEYFAALYTKDLPDDIQTKLLDEYTSHWGNYSNYFNILYYLEKYRFDKNVLYPKLIQLKNSFNKCNKSYYKLLDFIYSKIKFSIYSNSVNCSRADILDCTNECIYYFTSDFGENCLSIIDFICFIKNFKNFNEYREISYKLNYGDYTLADLKQVFGSEECVLNFMYPFKYQVDFCLKILDEIENRMNVLEKAGTSGVKLIDQL